MGFNNQLVTGPIPARSTNKLITYGRFLKPSQPNQFNLAQSEHKKVVRSTFKVLFDSVCLA